MATFGPSRDTRCSMSRDPRAIPVLIVGLRQMTRDLVTRVLAGDARASLHEHVRGADLAAEVDAAEIRLVVTSSELPALSDACVTLLLTRPQLRVLALGLADRSGDRFEMQPVRIHYCSVSPENVLEAFEAAGSDWPEWQVSPAEREQDRHA